MKNGRNFLDSNIKDLYKSNEASIKTSVVSSFGRNENEAKESMAEY
jgi:hypothetical protein